MVQLGQQTVGRGAPCFITFDAGATHNGLDSALALSSEAARADAQAVKFQIFDPDRLVADKKMGFSYQVFKNKVSGETEMVDEPLYDILCRRYLTDGEWMQVKAHCDYLGLAFFATVGFEEDIRLLEKLGCDSIKIASADINHWPLIRQAARSGMSIQIDNGNATLGEVEQAVNICEKQGNRQIIIHNCPSGYPAHLESINLNLIATLKQMFPDLAVAYSDHTPGWEMEVAALAMGADLLEKNITLDRTIKSPEHMFSLEPGDMKRFVTTIREVETAMGKPRRIIHAREKEMQLKTRRSAHVKKRVSKGQKVTLDVLEFRRPGTGIAPDRFESFIGLHFAKDLARGHMLAHGDIIP